MGYRVERFETTPNPNATKAVLDRAPPDTPRAYRSPPEHDSDPIASALFAIQGVTTLLIHDGWIAVGKSPDASWATIKRRVRAALARLDTSGDG